MLHAGRNSRDYPLSLRPTLYGLLAAPAGLLSAVPVQSRRSAAPMAVPGKLYADLSGYYDSFCAEVDYAEQCAFVARAHALLAASGGHELLDLACGSGQHLALLQELGFRPNGLDNSPAMLALAATRCPQAELQLCDLARFGQVEAFDLITCLLYSIHYSHPVTALRQTLDRAWKALKPGGVFIFNAVDARGIRNGKGLVTHASTEAGRLEFRSGWHYAGDGEVMDLALTITRESDTGIEQWQDQHTMTALTVPQLQQWLEATGFTVELFEHDYARLVRWNGASFNVIIAAGKPVCAT